MRELERTALAGWHWHLAVAIWLVSDCVWIRQSADLLQDQSSHHALVAVIDVSGQSGRHLTAVNIPIRDGDDRRDMELQLTATETFAD